MFQPAHGKHNLWKNALWQEYTQTTPIGRNIGMSRTLYNLNKFSLHHHQYGFLCGILSSDLVQAQQRHYDDIHSHQKGRTWAAKVIPKLWHMLLSLWIHRNSCLHNTDAINSVHGLEHLRTAGAVTSELSLGLGLLPHLYRSYFTTYTSTLLLSKPVYFLKRWLLLVICTARKRFQLLHRTPSLMMHDYGAGLASSARLMLLHECSPPLLFFTSAMLRTPNRYLYFT